MLVLIRGAGDLATGVALRLYRSGFQVVMTDLEHPTAIRRTVCFSMAIPDGITVVEGITARRAEAHEVQNILQAGEIPVLADPDCRCLTVIRPHVLVDAILAKRNLGTSMEDAPVVIGLGPGFTAGKDCHAVIETMRGHSLGRVILEGSAQENTAVPGLIGGYAGERVLRAPADGIFRGCAKIGDAVVRGQTVGYVGELPMTCTIGGVLRGLLADGTPVHRGMKAGDVDPRGKAEYCHTASDKALAIGGGVLEAVLNLTEVLHHGG